MLKLCYICQTHKPLSDFNKSRLSKDGLQYKCKVCGRLECRQWYAKNIDHERIRAKAKRQPYGPKDRERNRKWALANPEQVRYHSRKKLFAKKYNMTIAEHDALFASQGFSCGACGSITPNSKKGWSTDHCHTTGIVRGILCHHCNVGLGHAKDNTETLRAWVSYLEKPRI